MSRRPIERVPIAEQCARCFRRRLPGELLCRTHLHLKFAQREVAERQMFPLTHQGVGRGVSAADSVEPDNATLTDARPLPTQLREQGDRSVVAESRPRTGRAQHGAGVYPAAAEALPGKQNDTDAVGDPASRAFPALSMNQEQYRQAKEAASFGSSVLVPILEKTCSHGGADWCDWCASWQAGAEAADFDDGGPT